MIKIIFIILGLLLGTDVYALDRCQDFIPDVRSAHTRYFGPAYPYWYGVGQLKQESCCKANVTAFDKGMGIAQFMPTTSKYIQSLMGEKLDPYNPEQATRMQAFYMARIHKKENWTKSLWIDYQIYNGGRSLLYKEYQRAGKVSHESMKSQCQRKKIKMKWGTLDLCDVNYDYSKKIFTYGKSYKKGSDSLSYW